MKQNQLRSNKTVFDQQEYNVFCIYTRFHQKVKPGSLNLSSPSRRYHTDPSHTHNSIPSSSIETFLLLQFPIHTTAMQTLQLLRPSNRRRFRIAGKAKHQEQNCFDLERQTNPAVHKDVVQSRRRATAHVRTCPLPAREKTIRDRF